MLVHGRYSYKRVSLLVLYFFYKNLLIAMINLWWSFFTGFSGQVNKKKSEIQKSKIKRNSKRTNTLTNQRLTKPSFCLISDDMGCLSGYWFQFGFHCPPHHCCCLHGSGCLAGRDQTIPSKYTHQTTQRNNR